MKRTIYTFFLLSIALSTNASDSDIDDSGSIESQLNGLYKSNRNLHNKLTKTDESLSVILANLQTLNSRLEYKLNSENSYNDKNTVTLSDFESTNNDLIRKCDEIVDNFYSRKIQQEKIYLNDLLNTEQNDPEWANSIENTLQNFLNDNSLTQSSLTAIDCKVSVCRFSMQHQSNQAASQFKSQLRNNSGLDVYNAHNKFDRATGDFITTVTLVRNKRELRHFIWNK